MQPVPKSSISSLPHKGQSLSSLNGANGRVLIEALTEVLENDHHPNSTDNTAQGLCLPHYFLVAQKEQAQGSMATLICVCDQRLINRGKNKFILF